MTTPSPAPTPTPGTRSLRIALLAVGSALVAALLVLATLQFAQAATGADESGTYIVPTSFAALDVDVSEVNVTVRYDDVAQARLDFHSGGSPLRFEHEVRGDTLALQVHRRGLGVGLFPSFDDARLDVVLPTSLAPVALDLRSSAGDSDVAGTFARTSLASSAGNIHLRGSTGALRVTSSAGDITATALDASGSVVTDSSAGNTRLSFVSLPSSIRATGSAGDIEVGLPDGDYDVRASTSFGNVRQGLRSTPGADRRYTFETSAGDIALRSE